MKNRKRNRAALIALSGLEFKIVTSETENEMNHRHARRRKTIGLSVLSLARSLQMFCVWADLEASRPQ